MAKLKTSYICESCHYTSLSWLGKCPQCQSWNSFHEHVVETKPDPSHQSKDISQKSHIEIRSFKEILHAQTGNTIRAHAFSAPQLQSFFGSGGLVTSSLTLMAGEPGIGKSTFALQLLRALHNGVKDNPPSLLYVTAEESESELALRAKRLMIPDSILCVQANNFEKIERIITKEMPHVVIIDSIQTIYGTHSTSNPGSVAQVSTLTNQFLALAKSKNIAIILIGHVTKEGQIAGPKTLEHMVDSVLVLEQSEQPSFRTLSFSKHRFGSTENLLLLKMEQQGLTIVTDPSLVLLENIEKGVGICYGIAIAKNIPFVVEIQALVNTKYEHTDEQGNVKPVFGKRDAIGIKLSKLHIIIAVIEKYLGIKMSQRDVYIQLTGMPKHIEDDSLDLPILLAIISSVMATAVEDLDIASLLQVLLTDASVLDRTKQNVKRALHAAFAGRITLSGSLRKATSIELRAKTASQLGFQLNHG